MLSSLLKSLKCRWRGHLYVDSRSQPGTKACVRCRHHVPFEGLTLATATEPRPGKAASGRTLRD